MVNIAELAVEVANGDVEVNELIQDAVFLKGVDNHLRKFVGKNIWSDEILNKKREQIQTKIKVLEE